MSRSIAIIPIKTVSKRIAGKNFKLFAGHPLYKYIISAAVHADCFQSVYVDTDSDEIKAYARKHNVQVIDRLPVLAKDNANGNHLLCYHAKLIKEGSFLFQLFATAPLLSSKTIKSCVTKLEKSKSNDSILTVTEECGWFWFEGKPVNYRPEILPRSQDAKKVVKETTGLYGISRKVLEKYKTRIGRKPYLRFIDREEALDIDTPFDLQFAEMVAKKTGAAGWVLK